MLQKHLHTTVAASKNISRYIQAMRERPAYKRAMEKVGKTTMAG